MTTYRINHVSKSWERDDFEQGCIGPGSECDTGLSFSASTKAELVQKFAAMFDTPVADVELDVCDEPGRIEVSRTETGDGSTPSARELEEWKAGRLTLYYATYTGYAVESRPVSFEDLSQ